MMLGNWTWQQVGLSVLLLSLLWYVGVAWYYRRELLGFLGLGSPGAKRVRPWLEGGSGTGAGAGLGHDAERMGIAAGEDGGDALMGRARLPEGMQQLGSQDFGFVGLDDDGKVEQLGLIADVMEELKGLFADLSAGDGQKVDFLSGMDSIRGRYPKLSGHPRLAQLNEFILVNAPFFISKEELEDLWT